MEDKICILYFETIVQSVPYGLLTKVNEYCVVIVLIQKKIPSTILLLYIVLEFLFFILFKFFKRVPPYH